VLAAFIAWEVGSRSVDDEPHAWAFDAQIMIYGTLFMLAGAYTLAKSGHVRGYILYGYLSYRRIIEGKPHACARAAGCDETRGEVREGGASEGDPVAHASRADASNTELPFTHLLHDLVFQGWVSRSGSIIVNLR